MARPRELRMSQVLRNALRTISKGECPNPTDLANAVIQLRRELAQPAEEVVERRLKAMEARLAEMEERVNLIAATQGVRQVRPERPHTVEGMLARSP